MSQSSKLESAFWLLVSFFIALCMVICAKQSAIWGARQVLTPAMSIEEFGALMYGGYLGMFLAILSVPRTIIMWRNKESPKKRWELNVVMYFVLPAFVWLFLPEVPLTIAFTLIATVAVFEVCASYTSPQKKT